MIQLEGLYGCPQQWLGGIGRCEQCLRPRPCWPHKSASRCAACFCQAHTAFPISLNAVLPVAIRERTHVACVRAYCPPVVNQLHHCDVASGGHLQASQKLLQELDGALHPTLGCLTLLLLHGLNISNIPHMLNLQLQAVKLPGVWLMGPHPHRSAGP